MSERILVGGMGKSSISAKTDLVVRIFMMLATTFFSTAFAKFLVVGVINVINGIVLAWLYSLVLQANVAFVVGYLTSVTVSFFLNSWIVFNSRRTWPKYARFLLSYIPNFLIQNVCVIVVYNVLSMDKLIAYALAAIVGVPVTFLLLKFFAFAEKKAADFGLVNEG